FISGKATKVRNSRTLQTTKRVQRTLAAKKAEGADTHGVRRVLKRLSGRRRRRTQDFARVVAKRLVVWAPAEAGLVVEDLQHLQRPAGAWPGGGGGGGGRALGQQGGMRGAVANKAQLAGLALASVNPAYTSQNCSRCGLRGKRHRHQFACLSCG